MVMPVGDFQNNGIILDLLERQKDVTLCKTRQKWAETERWAPRGQHGALALCVWALGARKWALGASLQGCTRARRPVKRQDRFCDVSVLCFVRFFMFLC